MLLAVLLAAPALALQGGAPAQRRRTQLRVNNLPGLAGLAPKTQSKMPDIPDLLKEPGLKVPATAWKWPRSWPYAADGMVPVGETAPTALGIFDDAASAELASHMARHLPSNAGHVLEITGAGDATTIPEDGSDEEIWFPPKEVTRSDSAAFVESAKLPYLDQTFDVVILANTAELLKDPRAAFREVWRVLRPGGRAMVAFSSARCSPPSHAASMMQMWKDYNDAQRIWVVGSYFHFSAGAPAQAMVSETGAAMKNTDVWGAGWRSLRGFDYNDAAEANTFLSGTSGQVPLFVVQADRAAEQLSGDGAVAATDAALWAAMHMEEDDKRLCATRILSLVDREAGAEAKAAAAARNLPHLYETLQPMSAVIATPLLAQLAANLAPRWDAASASQTAALRESLGMDTPRDEFWKPLSERTANLSVDDKLWLLNDVLPFFKKADGLPYVCGAMLNETAGACREGALDAALRVVSAKTAATDDRERQLLAVDLVCRDFLPDAASAQSLEAARGKAATFSAWLETLTANDFAEQLSERLDFRDLAKEALDLEKLDPETAREKSEAAARAALVEAMLNEIARRREQEAAAKKA
ncbi:hypothetical protein M885DRAFT_586993 [Pelagophyceae sp. CCMP2097]|nr:hypothetical protein M885DRAFT_586993 [Pelagophyceae sp. CCMP2097]